MDKTKSKFTLTAKDFDWEFFPAGGNGGQKQNKTSSACRCSHPPSGAVGISRDERSQNQNKKLAFERCVKSQKFQLWAQRKINQSDSREAEIAASVERELSSDNIKIETKDANGVWQETTEGALTNAN